MDIVICGGTGLIGSKLVETLVKETNHIYILTRNSHNKVNSKNITYVQWLNEEDRPENFLENVDVVINLAGETINNRWTEKQKERILTSRIEATRSCIDLMSKMKKKPSVFLNASAVGFYGTSFHSHFTEADTQPGTDFLATVVAKWETEAKKAEALGIRTVLLRLGVVLASNGGALSKMILPYKLFTGGTIGTGKQWLSWIHIDDVIKLILFSMKTNTINGPINVAAPNPVKMNDFGHLLAKQLHKPHWLPVPSFALKLLLGEMSMLVLEGQHVLPKKAIDHGFQFSYSNLNEALENLEI